MVPPVVMRVILRTAGDSIAVLTIAGYSMGARAGRSAGRPVLAWPALRGSRRSDGGDGTRGGVAADERERAGAGAAPAHAGGGGGDAVVRREDGGRPGDLGPGRAAPRLGLGDP